VIGAGLAVKDASGGPLVVAVVDPDPLRFVAPLSIDGIDELLLVPTPTAHYEAHVWQRALEELIEMQHPKLVLLGHTIDSLGFGPAVAAKGSLGFASDVVSLSWANGPMVSRGVYGDKLISELEFPGKECTLVMLRPGMFQPALSDGNAVSTPREVDLALEGAAATEHVGFEELADDGVDITKSPFLLSIGRGIEDEDQIPRFQELAERLGATLSVSRPLVDAGWVSSGLQVGQSGKTVEPRLYMALGISGAVQHLAGMRTAETIIAVNTDPDAPIFGIADYGAVADLFAVADELEQLLD
jgi:electron transfer flavoprotein alpha subunit